MLFFLRIYMVAICSFILVAFAHDATVGTLSGNGAAGGMACLLVISMCWRGLDYLEAQ